VLTSTLLTLVVVPVAYTYLDSLGKRAKRFFQGAQEPHGVAGVDELHATAHKQTNVAERA
jgi:hypothetical protein